MKYALKQKAQDIKGDIRGTGGGAAKGGSMTDLELSFKFIRKNIPRRPRKSTVSLYEFKRTRDAYARKFPRSGKRI